MIWLRTGFVRMLVAIFLVAQFAGGFSPPIGRADPVPSVLAQHVPSVGVGAADHPHGCPKASLADRCCALHGAFVGIVCSTVAVERPSLISTLLAPDAQLWRRAYTAVRLDRPPKTPA